MKKYILLCVVMLFISGCYANVKYNTKTGQVTYTRLGEQKLNGLEITFQDPNGRIITVKLESQESKVEFAKQMFELGLKAGKVAVIP